MAELGTMDANFKEVYASIIQNLVPDSAKTLKLFKFEQADEIGNKFHQPVILSQEGGITYSAPSQGAFAINTPIGLTMGDAQVDAYQILAAGRVSYEQAAKSTTSKKAFRQVMDIRVQNLFESIAKRQHIANIYGRSGIGLASTSANISTTSTLVTFTAATWATGIWSGLENHQVVFFNHATGALISSSTDAVFVVGAVDPVNFTVTFTGTATGIAALDTLFSGGGTGDCFFYLSRTAASTYGECVGLDYIISNTSSSVFNIDASTYSLWKGNTYSCGSAALSISKILSGLNLPIARGLEEDAYLFVNPWTWSNVASEQTGNRRYDAKYSKTEADNGFESIKYFSSNGMIEMISESCIKQGEAILVPAKAHSPKRIGSVDITFQRPFSNDKFFVELPSNAGFEIRCYTGQSVFTDSPARCLKYTNIVNS